MRRLVSAGNYRASAGGVVGRVRNIVNTGRSVAQGLRMLRDRSRTITAQTKKRMKTPELKSEQGLNVYNCGVIRMYRKKPKHGKLLGTYHYNNVNQYTFSGLQGHQNADYAEILFGRDQLVGGLTSNLRADRGRLHDDLFKLNPFYAVPGSVLYGANTGVSRTDVLYIKNVKFHLDMLSMIKVPMEVTVYFMTPKFDTDTNPVNAWTNILDAKSLGQVAQVGAQDTITAVAQAGTSQIIDYGENPFHHREFLKLWTSVCTKKLVLQPGEQINLKGVFDYEKIVAKQTITDNRDGFYMKGLTIVPVVIIRAGLQGIAVDEVTAAAEVSYAPAKLGMVFSQKMEFGALPQSRLSTSRTYTGQIVSTTQIGKTIDDDEVIIPTQPPL